MFNPEAMNDIKAAWAEAVHIYKTEKPPLLLPESVQKTGRGITGGEHE